MHFETCKRFLLGKIAVDNKKLCFIIIQLTPKSFSVLKFYFVRLNLHSARWDCLRNKNSYYYKKKEGIPNNSIHAHVVELLLRQYMVPNKTPADVPV